MKKILTAVLCLGIAGTLMLGSCGKDEQKSNTAFVPEIVEEELPEVVIPEEQLNFEFEIDSINMEARITNYIGEDANVVIPEIMIDPTYGDELKVTVIGSMAFAKNETVEVVILPETVREIKKGAFQSCPNLRAVSLPGELETIDDYAFYNSNKLDKLGMLVEDAAIYETKDEEAVAEAAVTEDAAAEDAIAEDTVEETETEDAVAEEVVEETEEVVAEDATAEEAVEEEIEVNLYDLITDEFPATVEEIGLMAFSSQLNVTPWYAALEGDMVILGDGILVKYNIEGDYTLGENIKSVAYYAFTRTGDAVITIENAELEFDSDALFDCSKNLKFLVPFGAEDLASSISGAGGKYEFLPPVIPEEQIGFEFDINETSKEATITGYVGDKAELTIPDIMIHPVLGEELKVIAIADSAFENNEVIEVVVLPEAVKTIGVASFSNCPNLRAVSLPAGLRTIGEKAFYGSVLVDKLGMLAPDVPVEEVAVEEVAVEEVAVEEVAVEEVATEEAVAEDAAEETTEEATVEAAEETAEETVVEEAVEAVEIVEVTLYDKIGNEFPVTVDDIGLLAFAADEGDILWYTALEGDEVILGRGILVKYNAQGDYTLSEDVKEVAYHAFANEGAALVTLNNADIVFNAEAVFECDEEFKFVIPDEETDFAASIISAGGKYIYVSALNEQQETSEETAEGEVAEGEATEDAAEETATEAVTEEATAEAATEETTAEAATEETTVAE